MGTSAAEGGLDAKATAIAVLNKFKDEGLFVTKVNADGTETMVKTKIGQKEYDRVLEDWNRRNNEGFTPEGRKKLEEERRKKF